MTRGDCQVKSGGSFQVFWPCSATGRIVRSRVLRRPKMIGSLFSRPDSALKGAAPAQGKTAVFSLGARRLPKGVCVTTRVWVSFREGRRGERQGISHCSEIGCHSDPAVAGEESRPDPSPAIPQTQSEIPLPRLRDRNDISWFVGARQRTGMRDCGGWFHRATRGS